MIQNYRILGLIPARGSNDKLDHLNIKILGGNPMITYSIREALRSIYIDRLIISTEDAKTANIAKESGADVPFIRPQSLCGPDVLLSDVVKHALENLAETYDVVATLFPNAPFRTHENIDSAIDKLINSDYEKIISVEEKRDYFWIEDNNKMLPLTHRNATKRNECKPIYRAAGGIVVSWVKRHPDHDTFDKNAGFYVMKEHNAKTITSLYDLLISERLIKLNHNLIEELLNSE